MSEFSFSDMMRQVEKQMQDEGSVFINDATNPNKVIVGDPGSLFNRPLSPIEEQMMKTIYNVDEYSWKRGQFGGLRTGMPLFDEATEGGLQPGLVLLAAQPNVGKSALMLQMAKGTAELNDNVYVAYFSLDDSNNELLPRWVACDQQITIAQARTPEKFMEQAEIMRKRNQGIMNLYRLVNKFGMFDTNSVGTSVEAIEAKIKELLIMLPEGTKLAVFVDNFYDITVDSKSFSGNDKAKYEHTADEVKRWAIQYDIPVVCTAELRKLNGNKRPTVDDLRETTKIAYEANLVGLLYNEVGIMEENANLYWIHEDSEEKMPVIEFRFGKNKFGSFKGTRFYEFIPNMSYCIEAPIESCRRYASMLHSA